MSINWNNIRPIDTSLNDGFEELIRQLARREVIEGQQRFVPLGKPDAGMECFWILENDDEWGWQAKFFTESLNLTRWGELDHSVKTAIDKHPNLKKYIVALPINPPDARLPGQKSLLERWNERVRKWTKWATDKDLNVDFEPWWSSDIIFRLAKPENSGLTYFFFNKEEFTDEWFREQTELSITQLGGRYTPQFNPKLNVKLEIAKIFNGIARDENFEAQIREVFDHFIIKSKKAIPHNKDLGNEAQHFQNTLNDLYILFTESRFLGVDPIPYEKFNSFLGQLDTSVNLFRNFYLDKEKELQEKSTESSHYQYSGELNKLREFDIALENFKSFICSTSAKLSEQPVLLLDGKQGVGKSHLIADVVKDRNSNRKFSLLILGQHLVTNEDPWIQILKKLDIKCKLDEFLGALNSKAECTRSRLIIFIDSLSDGQGKFFWADNIRSFVQKTSKYEWLGLVLSVRTSYKPIIFPEANVSENLVLQHTHHGFTGVEFEATKLFFDAYKIQLPNVPLLHPEFQNPLFLKLFCDGLSKSGHSYIPDGLNGITAVINLYVQSINSCLAQPSRLDFPSRINVVQKAIDALIAEKIEKKSRYVTYDVAFGLVEKILGAYSAKKGLLEELVSEGLLTVNPFWTSRETFEDGVYLTYDRFEDHLTVKYLLDKFPDLETAFALDGPLFYLVADEHACYINKGLLEAFTVQVPEKTGREFYEYVPHIIDKYPVLESFVQSLLWRKKETMSDKQIEYINAYVLSYRGTHDLFWDTILSVTAIPDHYFNAYALHKNLMRFSLADRDEWWTAYLKFKFTDETAVKRLIDWAWTEDDKDYLSNESLKLASITLAWFHTSTNRKLRDSATKALICLLVNKIEILIDVMDEFKKVNDPYIYERLFAVAYGCAVRTKQKDALPALSYYIYKTIFDKEGEIYPHILLRDYARNVIEYTIYLGHDLDIDLQKIRPPYKSTFPEKFPSNDVIDRRYRFDYEAEGFKDHYWGQNHILNSMTTEYGRGTGGYGDFGRYVFQSALESWMLDENSLSNLAIEWIFEKYGYDVEKHGKFDREIGFGRGRSSYPNERIGKKYQWLALYELLARVSDNFVKYEPYGFSSKKVEPYDGTWNPYVRDIDPTMLIRITGDFNEDNLADYWWMQEKYSSWNFPNNEWARDPDDLPNAINLINATDESGEEWFVLEGHPEWAEPKILGDEKWSRLHKRMWYQIRSYFVKNQDFGKLKKWAVRQDFMGRWMPENSDRYQIFSREYYWSPAYKSFWREYNNDTQWQKIQNRGSNRTISKVIVTSESFFWEEEFDHSKEKTIGFLKPCLEIYEKLNLKYSEREGEFVDMNGKVICFDPSVNQNCKQFLLIRKNELTRFLQENGLRIVWTVIGEKNIIGDYINRYERVEISGFCYLENGKIDGDIIKKIG